MAKTVMYFIAVGCLSLAPAPIRASSMQCPAQKLPFPTDYSNSKTQCERSAAKRYNVHLADDRKPSSCCNAQTSACC
jgi:hypothetical protein